MYLEADHRFKMNLSLAGSRTSHWRFGCWMVLTISLHCLKTSKTTTWMSFNPWKQEQKTCICISYKVNLTGTQRYISFRKNPTPLTRFCGLRQVGIHVDAASGGFIAPFQVALLLLLGSGGEKFGGFPPAKIPKNRMARASNFGQIIFLTMFIHIRTHSDATWQNVGRNLGLGRQKPAAYPWGLGRTIFSTYHQMIMMMTISRWWFQVYLIVTPSRGNDAFWLYKFFKWVETSNAETSQLWTTSQLNPDLTLIYTCVENTFCISTYDLYSL